MANNRTVTIEGQDVGFGTLMENLKKQGKDMYEGFQKEAETYSNKLDEQHRKVENLIKAQREKLNLLRDEQRMAAQMQLEERLRNAHDLQGMKDAKEQHRNAIEEIDGAYRKSAFVTSQAQSYVGEAPQSASGGGGGSLRGAAARGMGTGRAMIAGMGGGLMVGGINEMIMSMFREGAELEVASLGLSGMTGTNVGSPGLGLKTATAANLAKSAASQRGIAGPGFAGAAQGQMMTEKAFGLGFGELGGLNQFARQGGGNIMDLTEKLIVTASKSKLWEIDKGDFSALNEKMGMVADIMSEEKQTRESGITGNRAVGMLSAFGKYGGGWADDRAGERIASISAGIKNPVNDFVKAEMMRSLIGDNPGMDLLGLRQTMAGGMGADSGAFKSILGGMQERFGKGSRMLQTALGVAFPQFMSNPEALATMSNMNPEDFSEDMMLNLKEGKYNISGRAHGKTGTVESNQARLQNAMAKTGIQLISSLSGMVEMLITGFEKLPGVVKTTTEVIQEFGDFFKDLASDPKSTMGKEWTEHKKYASTSLSAGWGYQWSKWMGTDKEKTVGQLVRENFGGGTGNGATKLSGDIEIDSMILMKKLADSLDQNTQAIKTNTTGINGVNKVKTSGKYGK